MEKTETAGTTGTKRNQFNGQSNGHSTDAKDQVKKGTTKQKNIGRPF